MPEISPNRRLLRLFPHPHFTLPFAPALGHSQSPADYPEVRQYALSLLCEASTLASQVPTWTAAGVHSSLETGHVDTTIYRTTIMPECTSDHARQISEERGPEHWVARISVHENKPVAGTGSFKEFYEGVKRESNRHELEYIPPMKDFTMIAEYNGLEGELEGGIKDVDMRVYENIYKMASELPPFAIPLLIATAMTSPASFLVVTVPVMDTTSLPASRIREMGGPEAIIAYFAAVTRVRLTVEGKVEWLLATTVEPPEGLGMSRNQQADLMVAEVARDVGRLVGWFEGKREKDGEEWKGD